MNQIKDKNAYWCKDCGYKNTNKLIIPGSEKLDNKSFCPKCGTMMVKGTTKLSK